MPLRLDSQSADFSERFRAFLAVKREAAQDVEASVRRIIAEVKALCIGIGVVGVDRKLRVLTSSEIADYLEEVE